MSQDKNMLPERISFKNLMKQSVFKVYLFASLFMLIALGLLAAYLMGVNKQVEQLNARMGQELEISNQDKAWLLQLFEADEKVIFEGKYQEAMADYTAIKEKVGAFAVEAIDQRIERIQSLLSDIENDNQNSVNQELLLAQTKKRIQELETEWQYKWSNSQEQVNTLKENLKDAQEALEKKDRQLNRKEKVQIITFEGQKGAKIHYLGEVENGKAQGGGMGIWTTGSIYRGEWKDNKRHGKGTFEWADGEKYDGDYNNDIREGTGTYYWPSGERYEGNWANNMRQGEGKLFDKDGNISYSGLWDKDKPAK